MSTKPKADKTSGRLEVSLVFFFPTIGTQCWGKLFNVNLVIVDKQRTITSIFFRGVPGIFCTCILIQVTIIFTLTFAKTLRARKYYTRTIKMRSHDTKWKRCFDEKQNMKSSNREVQLVHSSSPTLICWETVITVVYFSWKYMQYILVQ